MMEREKYNCPVEAALSQLGGKYKAIILYHLIKDGVLRYSELQKVIPRATPKMLTQQLRELEAAAQDGVFPHRAGADLSAPHQRHVRLGTGLYVRHLYHGVTPYFCTISCSMASSSPFTVRGYIWNRSVMMS